MTESIAPSSRTTRGQPNGAAAGHVAQRLEREAAIRRAVFVAALAGFAGIFGLIAFTEARAPVATTPASAPVNSASPSRRVLAEIPINTSDGATIVRIVAPEASAAAPRVRTRATP